MTNIHPFPKRSQAKCSRKNTDPTVFGMPFYLSDSHGHPADVLVSIKTALDGFMADEDSQVPIEILEIIMYGMEDLVTVAEVLIHVFDEIGTPVKRAESDNLRRWCKDNRRFLNRIHRDVLAEHKQSDDSITVVSREDDYILAAMETALTSYLLNTAKATCLAMAAYLLLYYRPYIENGMDTRKPEYNGLGRDIQKACEGVRYLAKNMARICKGVTLTEKLYQSSIGDVEEASDLRTLR